MSPCTTNSISITGKIPGGYKMAEIFLNTLSISRLLTLRNEREAGNGHSPFAPSDLALLRFWECKKQYRVQLSKVVKVTEMRVRVRR